MYVYFWGESGGEEELYVVYIIRKSIYIQYH